MLPIDKNREGGRKYAFFNLSYVLGWKAHSLQGSYKEVLIEKVVSIHEVHFEGTFYLFPILVKIMHELLAKKDIIPNVLTSYEYCLSFTNKTRKERF